MTEGTCPWSIPTGQREPNHDGDHKTFEETASI
jgi:hypothetical protein